MNEITKRLVIGRSERCDISINDPSVSRRHATIEPAGAGRFLLADMKSANGTYVLRSQGWCRVSRAQLNSTTRVRLGRLETTLVRLLSQAGLAVAERTPRKPTEPGILNPRRNPATGEIEEHEKQII